MVFGEEDLESPQLDADDSLEVEAVEHPFRFGTEGVGPLIVNAVNAMGSVGSDAEERYQRALEPLRQRAEEVVRLLGARQGLASVPEHHYVDRWSLVQLLSELEHPAAVKLLASIVEAPVPEERMADPHSFSTVSEEVMIRTTAVDGLERLARQGVEEAREVLLRQVDNEQLSIRRACVQALTAIGQREDLERLRRRLAQRDETWLLGVRRTDVQQVPQAEGGLFLAPPEAGSEARSGEVPPLDDAEDQHPALTGVLAKARRLAAHLLEVSEDDIVRLPDGRFGVRDAPERALTLGELAEAAADPRRLPDGMDPGLGPAADTDVPERE